MDDDIRRRLRPESQRPAGHRQPAPAQPPRPASQYPDPLPPVRQPLEPASRQRRRFSLRFFIIGLFILILLAATATGAYLYHRKVATKHYFPAYITKRDYALAAYYPVNLPAGYSVAGFKIIQHNILYYSVTNRAGDKFHLTLQSLPTSFDFAAFQKKFENPDQYQTPIGSNLVGIAGSSLIGSIQTSQNVWILLNSTAVGSINSMETITRSLRQVSL